MILLDSYHENLHCCAPLPALRRGRWAPRARCRGRRSGPPVWTGTSSSGRTLRCCCRWPSGCWIHWGTSWRRCWCGCGSESFAALSSGTAPLGWNVCSWWEWRRERKERVNNSKLYWREKMSHFSSFNWTVNQNLQTLINRFGYKQDDNTRLDPQREKFWKYL